MQLYRHQVEAVQSALNHFDKNDRGKLVMAFRTGKTVTSAEIAYKMNSQRLLFVAPTLFLLGQTVKEFKRVFPQVPILIVCSDDEVTEETNDITTSPEIIDRFLSVHKDKKCIVLCTYHSGDILGVSASNVGFIFDFGIFDEAHRTVGAQGGLFSYLIDEGNINIKKRMFMTATERFMRPDSIQKVISMDDESKYGSIIYRLTIGDAIRRKVLCDYDMVATVVTDSEVRDEVINSDEIIEGEILYDKRIYVAAITCMKLIQKGLSKKIICYFGRVKQSKSFAELINRLLRAHSELNDVEVTHVDGTGQNNRVDIESFKAASRAILSNVLIVREGLDVPDCDTVLFAVPKQGTIEILQMAGRALTISPGKEKGLIVIPCLVESMEHFYNEPDFSTIKHIISSMASGDERIIYNFYSSRELPLKAFFLSNFKENNQAKFLKGLYEAIDVRLLHRISTQQDFPSFEQARELVKQIMLPLGIKTRTAYADFLKNTNMPINIPLAPQSVYKNSGWVSWKHFLGLTEGRPSGYLPFIETKKWVQQNLVPVGIDRYHLFVKFMKGSHPEIVLPDNIPISPGSVYRKSGEWKGWPDFFGRKSMVSDFPPYKKAKKLAQKSGIKSGNQWYNSSPEERFFLPKTPYRVYKTEWEGWDIFLNVGFYSYEETKKWVQQNIGPIKNWKLVIGGLPEFIPKYPQVVYKVEWEGWDAFLGR